MGSCSLLYPAQSCAQRPCWARVLLWWITRHLKGSLAALATKKDGAYRLRGKGGDGWGGGSGYNNRKLFPRTFLVSILCGTCFKPSALSKHTKLFLLVHLTELKVGLQNVISSKRYNVILLVFYSSLLPS